MEKHTCKECQKEITDIGVGECIWTSRTNGQINTIAKSAIKA
ncbi:hypothetical protein [Brevibacillus choshinensis]|nr:hypothetical protein [Brevibacillus choshinensis]MED4783969.1 hypothetical protein [Brevibacillus choshinensis]